MKNIFIISIYLFFFTSVNQAQPRIVHWVHGFGANTSAWFPVVVASEQGVGSDFPARNIVSNNVTYTGPNIAVNRLSDAGAQLRMQIRDYLNLYTGGIGNPRAENSFVIAHSQGGLVSRWTTDISIPTAGSLNSGKHFGGLVTFGTPHAGAKIATSRFNGDLDVFLNQGCNDLGGAIFLNGVSNNKFYEVMSLLWFPNPIGRTVEELKSKLCNTLFSKEVSNQPRTTEFLSQRILGTLLSSGGTRSVMDDPLLYDYQQNGVIQPDKGTPQLIQLNNTTIQNGIVRVAFYGAEVNSQSFVRTLQYMAKPSQSLPAFEATDYTEDNGAILKMTELRNNLENAAIAKENEANAINLSSCWWYSPLGGYLAVLSCQQLRQNQINNLRSEAALYRKGYQWIDNSNAQWLSIIGARKQTVSVSGKCYCSFISTPISVPSQSACLSIGGCYKWETITTTTITDEDNDGVVPKSSALAMPGAITLNDADARMEGSQHMQMRNDPNTKAKLFKLYEGGIHSFFKTF